MNYPFGILEFNKLKLAPEVGLGLTHRPPHLFHHLIHSRIMLLQFRTHEGIKVIHAQIRLGALGKVLLMIVQPLMLHRAAGIEQDLFVDTLFLRRLVCADDVLVFKAEHLIMIRVRQFMQDHVRMLGPHAAINQSPRARDVHVLGQRRIMPIGAQPTHTRMILHRAQPLVVELQANRKLL